jgi:hypothetical protein
MIDDQRFGAVLLERSLLTEVQVRQLSALASSRQTSVYRAAVESRAVEEETAVRIAAKLLGVKAVSLKGFSAPAELVKLYPQSMMEQYRFVPISLEEGRLFLAMEDPTDSEALRIAGELWSGTLTTILVGPLDLMEVFRRLRGDSVAAAPKVEVTPFRFADPAAAGRLPLQPSPALGASLMSRGDAERAHRGAGQPMRQGPIDVGLDEGNIELETTALPERSAASDPFSTESLPAGQVSSPFLLSLGDNAAVSRAEVAARAVRQAGADELLRALVRALLARGLVSEAELAEQLHRKK